MGVLSCHAALLVTTKKKKVKQVYHGSCKEKCSPRSGDRLCLLGLALY